MRKNRIGLILIDGDDQIRDTPEMFNRNMERIQELIENLTFEVGRLMEGKNEKIQMRENEKIV